MRVPDSTAVEITRENRWLAPAMYPLRPVRNACESIASARPAKPVANDELAQRLRGDKRKLLRDGQTVVLAGGDTSMRPAKLAAARIWFLPTEHSDTQPRLCADGSPLVVVQAVAFDDADKITSATNRIYCGAAVYK